MRLLISFLHAVALVLTLPWWAYRLLRQEKNRTGLGERLGFVPERIGNADGAIWVHAVSVGEVLAVAQLIERLRKAYPERRIVISTTTATGQKLARSRFGEANVFYFPLDIGFAVRPYL